MKDSPCTAEIRIGQERLVIVDAYRGRCLFVRNKWDAQFVCREYGGYSWTSWSEKTCYLSLPERDYIYCIYALPSVSASVAYIEDGAHSGEIIHFRDIMGPMDGVGVVWHGRSFAVCTAQTLVDYVSATLRRRPTHQIDNLDISIGRVLLRAGGEWKETTASVRLPVLIARDDDGDHKYLRKVIDRHPAFRDALLRLRVMRDPSEIVFRAFPSAPISWVESSLLQPQNCVGSESSVQRMRSDTGLVIGRDGCIYRPVWRRLPSPIVARWTFEQFAADIARIQRGEDEGEGEDDENVAWLQARFGRSGARIDGSALVLPSRCPREKKERLLKHARETLLGGMHEPDRPSDPAWAFAHYRIDFGGTEPTVQLQRE
ncbi:MAG: hypothetical protein KatS3mg059_1815 [Thermomicrobiales bacterium]|nr:MAG: hypothetical protein KatS3mg059_1815 [Thermomicrobiales bacterium]